MMSVEAIEKDEDLVRERVAYLSQKSGVRVSPVDKPVTRRQAFWVCVAMVILQAVGLAWFV